MIRGIDTAARITPEAAKKLCAEGYRFVGRYLVPQKYWKALTAEEAKDIRGAGLAILLVYEIEAERAKRGAEIGTQDGITARELARAMGVPNGTAVYFAVDYDAPQSDFQAIQAYLVAARASLYPYVLGMYAPVKALDDIVGATYRWEAFAWGYGKHCMSANIRQTDHQEGNAAKALAEKIGVPVDLDEAASLAGMWTPSQSAAPTAPSEGEPSTAVKWARSLGITDDEKIAEALWRYHAVFSDEDAKTESGLLT